MEINEAKKRIKELIEILNKANEVYYNEDKEIMPNYEYDKLYDELKSLEEKFDIHLSSSPTNNVGYEVSDALPKVRHEKPMLSLDKTKDRETLKNWLEDNDGVLSYKLDGLTIVLTYENGELVKGVTRGNGEIGEDVTNNVKNFTNVPIKINNKGHIVLRGEAIISYSDFEKINETLIDNKYKNPRNLASGSVRQLDPKITKSRLVKLICFSLVEYDGEDNKRVNATYISQMNFLDELNFETVTRKVVDKNNILKTIEWYENDIKTCDYPSDGLVLMINDIEYGLSLGMTSKFPKNAIAFKWKDDIAETVLREIEWSPSRTGLINPVAIFDEVELEGTTVKRASLHNISIIEDMKIGIGDHVKVYKANMIIPQILESVEKSGKFEYPKRCPVCGSKTVLKDDNGVKTLYCENEECPIKHIKGFENFVSRNCMNIEGISIATIETFIQMGYIKEYADLYRLDKHKKEIVKLEGFGEKSYENIVKAIDAKRKVEFYRFINSLSILGIGTANAKVLAKHFKNYKNLKNAKEEDLINVQDIGPVLAKSINEYFHNKDNIEAIEDLLKEIELIDVSEDGSAKLNDMIFVITGSLETYTNRNELVKVIEDNGGKVATSVSNNTTYLINNDVTSNSTKNKKAKELGVKIISEKDFKELLK